MNQNVNIPHQTTRREFLKISSAATMGGIVAANLNFSTSAAAAKSDSLRVGLIGCGGRGTGAASQALTADQNVVLTALADVFPDQLHKSLSILQKKHPTQVDVPADRCFVGLDAFQNLIGSGLDVVLLATPPGFRPQHFKAAIEAGKHVFCEKPMATDVPGIRSVMESVAEAKRKKLAVVAGFCWRYELARRELFKRIHGGAIGDIKAIYATYYTGPVKPMPSPDQRPAGMTDLQWQLRNWYNFVWLSGDGLVEQAVHSVDKMAWAMKDVPPLKAVATGGRQIPNNEGNIFDHFQINYEFAGGVRGFLGCRQQAGCYSENNDYIIGSKGQATIRGGSEPFITGEQTWKYRYEGGRKDMYQTEHDELFASIRNGMPINDGDWMCSSTLMGLMGRIAAYTGQEITWEMALNSQEALVPANLDWKAPLPIRPMAMPGRTKYI